MANGLQVDAIQVLGEHHRGTPGQLGDPVPGPFRLADHASSAACSQDRTLR